MYQLIFKKTDMISNGSACALYLLLVTARMAFSCSLNNYVFTELNLPTMFQG